MGTTARSPFDPADHAEDFSRLYAQELDIAAGTILMEMGIDPTRLAATDPEDFQNKTFHPSERTGGSVTPDGRITIDSGVINPELMDVPYGEEAGDFWRSIRLRSRMQAVGTHEYEEHEGGSHEEALQRGPTTALAISDEAREMLRRMREGWRN